MVTRWQALIDQYGGEEEAKAEMKRRSALRKTYGGGLRALKEKDPDKVKEISSLGGKARWMKGKSVPENN